MSVSNVPKALRHTINVAVYAGDDVAPFAVHVRDTSVVSADREDYAFAAHLRRPKESASLSAVWVLTVEDSGDDATLDADTLRVQLDFPASETVRLGVGTWFWDLEVQSAGRTWTPVDGSLRVEQDVTR